MLEQLINELEKIGWKKFHLIRKNKNLAECLDEDKLLKKLKEINPSVPYDYLRKAFNNLIDFSSSRPSKINQEIFTCLSRGIDYGRYKVDFFFAREKDYKKNDFNYLTNLEIQ